MWLTFRRLLLQKSNLVARRTIRVRFYWLLLCQIWQHTVNIFWRSHVPGALWWAAGYWNFMRVNQYCIGRAQVTITLCPGDAWTYQLSLAVQDNHYLGVQSYPRKSANIWLCHWLSLHDFIQILYDAQQCLGFNL